ncbi:MAG: protein-L-isoaspartate O-methyltransferase [Myxococcales bacterium SG8_38]|nr:MAG: protein-L-isoaspartate O-methyltransferase [Myxococcales bacterium SG8_38]
MDRQEQRRQMVKRQIEARGVRQTAVLEAMRSVPREAFLPTHLSEFAYEDTPLPIEEGQTISQPYIVAAMAEALRIGPNDKVLEIGTGSGYAAAVLGEIAAEVYTIERHRALADEARSRLRELGYPNVHVLCGDGTLGWPEHAPFDAILVSAGGPSVPQALVEQLAPGGRMVIPVGAEVRDQRLLRVTKQPDGEARTEDLGGVRFVPLIGAAGFAEDAGAPSAKRVPTPEPPVAHLVREACQPFAAIDDVELGPLLDQIGDARVVLLGEATHGTSEFYRMRTRITTELVLRRGFDVVAIEGDWPDAARIDHHIRDLDYPIREEPIFTRFPTWMWRNREVVELIAWLKSHNELIDDSRRRVGFCGLDLYSLYKSIDAVLDYLRDVDPKAAEIAKQRYACLSPWERDPALYGRAAISRGYARCEGPVVEVLRDLLERRLEYALADGDRFFDATSNAHLVAAAEEYYRVMYYGGPDSWNLRDQHMFDTLERLLEFRGPRAKAVVWAHNSHVGDARATEMGAARGEHNIGQLCRMSFGHSAFSIGFGTHTGTVAAATDWGGPMAVKRVRPSHPTSYERLFHDAEVPAFLLALRNPVREAVREELASPRLERAIGVIYRPETELQSHYFQAALPWQFDAYVWFDETHAVRALDAESARHEIPQVYG